MEVIANDYFHNIFKAAPSIHPSHVINLVEPLISEEDNSRLCAPFSDKEISDAMCQIGTLEGSGPGWGSGSFFSEELECLEGQCVSCG